MRESILTEILIGIFACFIAVFIIVKSLQVTDEWTGFEQEERVAGPGQYVDNSVRGENYVLTAAVGAQAELERLNPQKAKSGKEFTKFGITGDMFMEGHWWGMEVENLTPLARQILKIPPKIRGLWVDETNLWAVRCGIKGADILIKINGFPVKDLMEFYQLTKRFRNRKKAVLLLLRGDRKISAVLAPGPPLGIAAMESAESLDPMTSDAAVDPLDLVEEAPADFLSRGYKALVSQEGDLK